MKKIAICAIAITYFLSYGRVAVAIDHLSLVTTPIILNQNQENLLQGTGFYYVKEDPSGSVLFLVTNHHVLTGSVPAENKPPMGNNIEFFLHKDNDKPQDVKKIKLPLYTKSSKPTWLKSKKYPSADIAVLPIPIELWSDCKFNVIAERWAEKKMKLRPTTLVTLIGYPHGYFDNYNQLPVWKTGHISSEPEYDFQNLPLILVDVSAFPGMSGSPVFAFADSGYESTQGGFIIGGKIKQFIGIYASQPILKEKRFLEVLSSADRQGITVDKSLNLGHIWKAELIVEIINNFESDNYDKEILSDLR